MGSRVYFGALLIFKNVCRPANIVIVLRRVYFRSDEMIDFVSGKKYIKFAYTMNSEIS